jgi:hypothetical protein
VESLLADFEEGRRLGREEAAWAILAFLVRSGLDHDPADVLRVAGVR